jgi:nucleoside-diphosphate-sugar epimerase
VYQGLNKPDLAGRTVLITGASGYLGSSLAHLLSERGARLIRVSRKPLQALQNAKDVVADICESRSWHGLLDDADTVMHLAGMTSVNEAEAKPCESLRANVLPMLHLLEECCRSGARPFIAYAGTCTEVGMPAAIPVDESFQDDPVTVYDLHKLFAERHLLHACRTGKAIGCSLRLSNVYGPSLSRSSSPDRGILNKVVRRTLAREPISIYGDGAYLRDYVYISDVCEAFLASMCGDVEQVSNRYFLIASGRGTTLRDAFALVAEMGERRTGHKVPVNSVPWPDGVSPIERRNFVADISAFSSATGWRPKVSLEQGVEMLFQKESVAGARQ